jgi:hypothetical protein
VAIELFVCGVDVSFLIQENFAHVDVTIACRPVQGDTLADAAENQQHIFKQVFGLGLGMQASCLSSFALTSASLSNNTAQTRA